MSNFLRVHNKASYTSSRTTYYYVHREIKGSSSGIHQKSLCSQINSVEVQADTKTSPCSECNNKTFQIHTKNYMYHVPSSQQINRLLFKYMYIPKTTMITAKKKRISSSVYQISPCSQRNNREQFKFKTTMMFAKQSLGVDLSPQNCLGLINVFRRGKALDQILNSYYVQN